MEQHDRTAFARRLTLAAQSYHAKSESWGLSSLVAQDFDVSIQTASKWLRGKVTPHEERWPKIAWTYRVSEAWLAGRDSNTPPSIQAAALPELSQVGHVGEAVMITLPKVREYYSSASDEDIAAIVQSVYLMLEDDMAKGDIARRTVIEVLERAGAFNE